MKTPLLWIAVFGIYIIVLLWDGIRRVFKNNNAEEYYAAGRGVSNLALLATVAMSIFSGLSYYGYPASIYKFGVGYLSGNGGYITALMFCTIGYRLWIQGKEYGFKSPSEFLRNRYYSESYGFFVAAVLFLFIIPYIATQVISIGTGIEVSSAGRISYTLAVGIGCVVIALHTLTGGMGSVAWMDTFHFFLGYGALALVLYFVATQNFEGGFLSAMQQAYQVTKEGAHSAVLSNPGPLGTYTVIGNINNALAGAIANLFWPHIFVRCFMAKGKKNFQVMAAALPIFYALCFFLLALIGSVLAPALLGPNVTDTDSVMPLLSTQFAPEFVTLISALCLCAFAVSTTDSFLLIGGQMAAEDIFVHWKYLKGEKVTGKKSVNMGRIAILFLMFAMLFVVFTRPASITDNAYKLASPFFGMIMPATILGLYWPRASREGAWAGTVSGLIVVVIFTFFATPPLGVSAFLWGLIVNFIVMIVVSLCTKVPEEIVDKYIRNVNNIITTGNSCYDEGSVLNEPNKPTPGQQRQHLDALWRYPRQPIYEIHARAVYIRGPLYYHRISGRSVPGQAGSAGHGGLLVPGLLEPAFLQYADLPGCYHRLRYRQRAWRKGMDPQGLRIA